MCVHLHIHSLIQCGRHEFYRHHLQLDILLLSLEDSNQILLETSVIYNLKLWYWRHVRGCNNTSSGPGILISDRVLTNMKHSDLKIRDEKVGEGKVFPAHTMKAYRGNRSIAPLILNLSTSWKWVVISTSQPLYHWERTLAPIEQYAVCASEPFCMVFEEKTSLAIARTWTPAASHVLIVLSRLCAGSKS